MEEKKEVLSTRPHSADLYRANDSWAAGGLTAHKLMHWFFHEAEGRDCDPTLRLSPSGPPHTRVLLACQGRWRRPQPRWEKGIDFTYWRLVMPVITTARPAGVAAAATLLRQVTGDTGALISVQSMKGPINGENTIHAYFPLLRFREKIGSSRIWLSDCCIFIFPCEIMKCWLQLIVRSFTPRNMRR